PRGVYCFPTRRSSDLFRDKLGIAQPADPVTWLEDHRRGNDRDEQGTAAHLIHAGDQLRAPCPSRLFVLQRAAEFLEEAQFQRRRSEEHTSELQSPCNL